MTRNLSYQQSRFDNIVTGFTAFAFGEIARIIIGNSMLPIPFAIVGWYYILKGFWPIKRSLAHSSLSLHYKFLLVFYLLLSLIAIIRGYMIDYPYQWISTLGMFNHHFIQKYYVLPYLLPFVCFIPWQYYKFDKLVKYATWVAVISIVSFVVLYPMIVASSMKALAGSGVDRADTGVDFRFYTPFAFVTLLCAYISAKKWWINVAALVSTLLICMISARRGQSLITAILCASALYLWSKYSQKRLGILAKIAFVLIAVGAVYFIFNTSLSDYLFLRGMEDNRSGVDNALLSQMTTEELFWGKGLNGRYYFPITEDDYLKGWRYSSETGFYTIVLRGGYLMAVTYILLLAIPAFKGMYNSNNFLCKAGGFYILLSLFELYPFGWPEFSVKFLVIWMLVPLCMSRTVRRMNNNQIKQQFF